MADSLASTVDSLALMVDSLVSQDISIVPTKVFNSSRLEVRFPTECVPAGSGAAVRSELQGRTTSDLGSLGAGTRAEE